MYSSDHVTENPTKYTKIPGYNQPIVLNIGRYAIHLYYTQNCGLAFLQKVKV